ncbi:MAG: PAS domain S-box protein, partial [Desulfobacterales bacterium]|nr:PAS domain S-box protein [Desulfobacterales bacterium]
MIMKNNNKTTALSPFALNKWLLVALWTLFIAAVMIFGIIRTRCEIKIHAGSAAHDAIERVLAVKHWSAARGGVYAPSSANTPNPHLAHVEERDIRTTDGRKLTLINPLLGIPWNERFSESRGADVRMTSLAPLRPENAPDEWESAALAELTGGKPEVREFTRVDGRPILRMMQPIFTDGTCVKCHENQGDAVGRVRGGVSVSLPMEPYNDRGFRKIIVRSAPFVMIWMIGLFIVLAGHRIASRAAARQDLAEKALGKKTEFQAALLSTMPAFIYFKDRQANYIMGSRALADLFGIGMADFPGRTDNDFYPPERAEFFRGSDLRVMESGKPAYNTTEPFIQPDGKRGWMLTSRAPFTNSRGEVEGVIGFSVDISTHKEALKALLLSESRLSSVVKTANEAIISIDSNGIINFWNQAAKRIFGYA